MAALPIAELEDILSRATPRSQQLRFPLKPWLIAATALLAGSIGVNLYMAEKLYGPLPSVGVGCLEVMVNDLARQERRPAVIIWRQLERDYGFESATSLSRQDGGRVMKVVLGRLKGQRSVTPAYDEP